MFPLFPIGIIDNIQNNEPVSFIYLFIYFYLYII